MAVNNCIGKITKSLESFLYFYLFTNTFRAVPQPFAFWVSINASNNACK